MASLSKMTKAKRDARNKSMGLKRKNKERVKSTPSAAEVFAEVDAQKGKGQ